MVVMMKLAGLILEIVTVCNDISMGTHLLEIFVGLLNTTSNEG